MDAPLWLVYLAKGCCKGEESCHCLLWMQFMLTLSGNLQCTVTSSSSPHSALHQLINFNSLLFQWCIWSFQSFHSPLAWSISITFSPTMPLDQTLSIHPSPSSILVILMIQTSLMVFFPPSITRNILIRSDLSLFSTISLMLPSVTPILVILMIQLSFNGFSFHPL